jgi:malonyl-CoA decarboxylase
MFDGLREVAQQLRADRAVRQLLSTCKRLRSERGEANSLVIGHDVVKRLQRLDDAQRLLFFLALARDFSPNPAEVLTAAQAYAAQPGARTLDALTRAAEPPRQELFRRINRAQGGTAAIVALRRELLGLLKAHPELQAVEADLLHLLSSWFNAGFLQMEQVSWRSSAELLEKIIQHEAVHAIEGWGDLRRRLQPDRRCFAFFHPQLPGEPLIFVEVALLAEMPAAIGALIDPKTEPLAPDRYRVAAFYSISNCQPGLRGVSLGNFLIKRVAQQLQRELPRVRKFCTLSPIPGFAGWLSRIQQAPASLDGDAAKRFAEQLQLLRSADAAQLKERDALVSAAPKLRDALTGLCAVYLTHESPADHGDPVARFHLDNGARLERINWAADLSAKGLRQSHGLMVNYLYDLEQVEAQHEKFVNGEVAFSRAVGAHL